MKFHTQFNWAVQTAHWWQLNCSNKSRLFNSYSSPLIDNVINVNVEKSVPCLLYSSVRDQERLFFVSNFLLICTHFVFRTQITSHYAYDASQWAGQMTGHMLHQRIRNLFDLFWSTFSSLNNCLSHEIRVKCISYSFYPHYIIETISIKQTINRII